MNTDITYCTRDCANIECFRNKVHIDKEQEYVWQCDFTDCEDCVDEAKDVSCAG